MNINFKVHKKSLATIKISVNKIIMRIIISTGSCKVNQVLLIWSSALFTCRVVCIFIWLLLFSWIWFWLQLCLFFCPHLSNTIFAWDLSGIFVVPLDGVRVLFFSFFPCLFLPAWFCLPSPSSSMTYWLNLDQRALSLILTPSSFLHLDPRSWVLTVCETATQCSACLLSLTLSLLFTCSARCFSWSVVNNGVNS